ncbi:ankyrin repeat domain-containing protein SOWAHA [Lissotriton helveticus]
MTEVSQEMLLRFLLQAGGKVKNSELLSRFKPLLDSPDPSQKATTRQHFKRHVNSLAVVKDEGGTKYVVLKKKYLQQIEARAGEGVGSLDTAPLTPLTTSSKEGPPSKKTDVIPHPSSSREDTSAKGEEGDLPLMSRQEATRRPRERTRSQGESFRNSCSAEEPSTTLAEEESQTWSLGEGPRRSRDDGSHPKVVPGTETQDLENRETPQRRTDPQAVHSVSLERCISPQEGSAAGGYRMPVAPAPAGSVRNANMNLGGERRLSLGALDDYQSSHSYISPKSDPPPRRRSMDLLEQAIGRARLMPARAPAEEHEEAMQEPPPSDPSLVQNREQSGDPEDTEQKRESVFTLVARIDQAEPASNPQILSNAEAKKGQPKEPAQKPYMLPLRCPPPQIRVTQEDKQQDVSTDQERTFLQNKEHFASTQAADMALPKSPYVKRRQHDEVGARSPHLKRGSRAIKANEESKFSNTVPLDTAEHDWLVKTTAGRWSHHLYGLLLNDSELFEKKDFMSGFTALHWAAKSGNSEMLTTLIEIAKKAGLKVDVNMRSFGGYTPLHVAAIHGREEVILKLVRNYGAKIHLRDWSGKKAYQYLQKNTPLALRYVLEDPSVFITGQGAPIKKNSKVASSILGSTSAFLGALSEDIPFHDLAKGLKKPPSLNKLLFNAPAGPKKKPKTRGSFASFSSLHEEGEEEVDSFVGKRRPKSEFYSQ